MQDEIFNLLMMILMLENGGGTDNINQLVLMFLMLNGKQSSQNRSSSCGCHRDGDFTF